MAPMRLQSFDESSDPSESASRIAALRTELARRALNGCITPRADRHQNEYVPPADERLRWLTGFTGSAGVAIVLAERAALFVDGRYTLQVRDEVDTTLFEIVHLTETPPHKWLEENLPQGLTVFALPAPHRKRLRTSNTLERVNQELKRRTRVARLFPNQAPPPALDRGPLRQDQRGMGNRNSLSQLGMPHPAPNSRHFNFTEEYFRDPNCRERTDGRIDRSA